MKFYQIKEGVGRIVKGVNTTPDVGPNEISKQAKKFGNTVDKDGRPPTLSKKVKGSSTNVLFNLGMSESIKERSLSKGETKKKEKYVKGMKKAKGDFEDRYGKDAKAVMYATATKMAKKNESVTVKDLDAPTLSIPELAEKYNVDQKEVLTQVKKGVKVEAEHTTDFDVALEIALDHLNEDLYYYDKLEKVEERTGTQLASSSEIYVDMDGVLADFFGEWAKLMKVDHYSKIDDIDINVALQKIRDTDEFWLNLPMLPQAKQLLGLIKKVKGSYNICSSPLADDPNSEPHKREWIKRNLDFFPPNKVIITHNKPKYAKQEDGTPNILIDDFGKNIASWEAAGGIGFKYKDHKFERTAKDIKQHMQQPVEENFEINFVTKLTKLVEKWSKKYKKSINCSNPKGFSQKAHCTSKKKNENVAEGYKLQLERDKEMLVLHIKDTDTGKRTEVRGKSGYESGGYDPKDKLHKLLDKIGKSADISQLMNGEPVGINPKHPQGASAKDATDKAYNENFAENKINFTMPNFDYEWGEANRYPEYRKLGKEEWIKLAKTGKVIDVNNRMANDIENTEAGEEYRDDHWDGLVKDKRDRFTKALSSGQIELPIIARYSDGYLELVAGNTRLTGMMRELGKAKAWIYDVPDDVADLEENFADGKKKGKSRPGRVKRSGASCNGSVTDLRKRAKNASGEKAKMYHWCANMKSGRKKGK